MSPYSRRLLIAVLALGVALMAGARPATAATNGSITIQWDANTTDPDLASYRVYLSTDSSIFTLTPAQAMSQATTRLVTKSTLETTFTSLDTSKTYYAAVTAIDTSSNESGFSNVASGQPFVAPTLTSLSPTSAKQGTGNLSITLTGSNFQATSTVDFGPGITVTSLDTSQVPTRLVAHVDVSALAEVSARNVSVINAGNATSTKSNGFTVLLDVSRVDINASNRIDGGDMVQVAAGFASQTNDPNYSVLIDLNVDGVVDGTDVALLITYFGSVGPF